MSTINTGNVVSVPAVIIDPSLFLPPGVVDFNYRIDDDGGGGPEFASADSGETIIVIDPKGPLRPPNYISIVSQTIHVLPTGALYVDVVIEIEDVPGAVKYEARLALA